MWCISERPDRQLNRIFTIIPCENGPVINTLAGVRLSIESAFAFPPFECRRELVSIVARFTTCRLHSHGGSHSARESITSAIGRRFSARRQNGIARSIAELWRTSVPIFALRSEALGFSSHFYAAEYTNAREKERSTEGADGGEGEGGEAEQKRAV